MKNGFFPTLLMVSLLMALLAMPVVVSASESIHVSHEIDVTLGYAGREAAQVAPSSQLDADLKYVASPQVTKDLLLRFGTQWQGSSFPGSRPLAAPATLQHANAILGFDYQVAEQWLMRAELQPGFYGDVIRFDGRRFDAPLLLGVVYLVDADLQWFFGLRADVKSQYPVFPAAGFRYRFADLWTLNMMFPDPRLEYDVNSRLKSYLGMGITAGTYVVGDKYGDDRGIPKLNHATVDFTELRMGPGFSWKPLPYLTLEAQAGYVLYRKWDFFDQNIDPTGHPVPYLRLDCKARF
ncbi:hypothetical protein [Geomonas sp.]|uniref:hypothetical protein n=1 Tax=Geomonas sp. TaxID=2651584 RepID=UPI002B4898DF|nr:hypothetical protein [Geomonas sp.]HJV35281.1 hypothetical protein [Geomonas sp.]